MDNDRFQSELSERRNLHGGRFVVSQSRIARVISRSLFFTVILLLTPHIVPILNNQWKFLSFNSINPHTITKQEFNELIDELKTAKILTKVKRNLVFIPVSNLNTEAPEHYAHYLRRMGADEVLESLFSPRRSFEDESFDIVFTLGQFGAEFVDRVLKRGGAVVVPVRDISVNVYLDELKYTCVYLKPFGVESIVMVVVKPRPPDEADADDPLARR